MAGLSSVPASCGPVLVVEDNDVDREAVARALGDSSPLAFRTTLAEGLDAAAEIRPSCVLLDLHLPDSAGAVTVERWLAARRDPVVVLTGLDDDDIGPHVVALGAQDYLPKAEVTGPVLTRTVRHARERHAAAEKARQLQAELRQSQRLEAVGRLAGGIAHDFNNLLTVINSFAELALDDTPHEDPRRHSLEQVLAAGERAAALTQKILLFSRRSPDEPRGVDLSNGVRDLAPMVRRLVPESVELVLLLDADVGCVPLAPTHLDQLVLNAVVNGVDAMPDGGTLTIETSLEAPPDAGDPAIATLSIRDTGVGMSQDVRERAVEPFFTTKGDDGTGLGLSTCYGIVTEVGGRMDLETPQVGGTRIAYRLPRTGAPGAPSTADRRSRERAETPRATVLLVEDQSALLELFSEALSLAGHRVLTARTADEARRIAETHEDVSVLVSDVVLPRGDSGVALARTLRARRPTLPVVLMSGYMGEEAPTDVLRESATFLAKPFRPGELVDAVASLLHEEATPVGQAS